MRDNPFSSKAQARMFFAKEARGELAPGTAQRWMHETPNFDRLPEHVSDNPSADEPLVIHLLYMDGPLYWLKTTYSELTSFWESNELLDEWSNDGRQRGSVSFAVYMYGEHVYDGSYDLAVYPSDLKRQINLYLEALGTEDAERLLGALAQKNPVELKKGYIDPDTGAWMSRRLFEEGIPDAVVSQPIVEHGPTVDDINAALFEGSLGIGASGLAERMPPRDEPDEAFERRMVEVEHSRLTELYGESVGPNDEWELEAWHVGGPWWILYQRYTDADGRRVYSLVRRASMNDRAVEVESGPLDQLLLVRIADLPTGTAREGAPAFVARRTNSEILEMEFGIHRYPIWWHVGYEDGVVLDLSRGRRMGWPVNSDESIPDRRYWVFRDGGTLNTDDEVFALVVYPIETPEELYSALVTERFREIERQPADERSTGYRAGRLQAIDDLLNQSFSACLDDFERLLVSERAGGGLSFDFVAGYASKLYEDSRPYKARAIYWGNVHMVLGKIQSILAAAGGAGGPAQPAHDAANLAHEVATAAHYRPQQRVEHAEHEVAQHLRTREPFAGQPVATMAHTVRALLNEAYELESRGAGALDARGDSAEDKWETLKEIDPDFNWKIWITADAAYNEFQNAPIVNILRDEDGVTLVSDEETGVEVTYYLKDAHGLERGDGWYVTVLYDTEHDTGYLYKDQGPFDHKDEAVAFAKEAAIEYCIDNDVNCDDLKDDLNEGNEALEHAMVLERIIEGNTGEERRIVTTFEVITDESAAEGDVLRHGFVYDDSEGEEIEGEVGEGGWDQYVDAAEEFLRDRGGIEPSSSHFHPGVWYSTADPDVNLANGEKTYYSYHLKGFTETEQAAIFKCITDIAGKMSRHFIHDLEVGEIPVLRRVQLYQVTGLNQLNADLCIIVGGGRDANVRGVSVAYAIYENDARLLYSGRYRVPTEFAPESDWVLRRIVGEVEDIFTQAGFSVQYLEALGKDIPFVEF